MPNEEGSTFWETVKILIIAAAIIIPVRLFVVQPFIVKGSSMETNFHGNDYILVDEITPRFRAFERGEVVIFKLDGRSGEYFIKRIIGLPGETITIKDGKINIRNTADPTGFTINEAAYLPVSVHTGGSIQLTLKADEIFVLGDNRGQSSDSRVWGALSTKNIIGRAWIRVYPFSQFTMINPGNIVYAN